jgi:hypothetical protein
MDETWKEFVPAKKREMSSNLLISLVKVFGL